MLQTIPSKILKVLDKYIEILKSWKCTSGTTYLLVLAYWYKRMCYYLSTCIGILIQTDVFDSQSQLQQTLIEFYRKCKQ